jgi:L-gulonate 5-dehydrogenase
MKAVVLSSPEQLALADWVTPTVGDSDVLVRPLTAGICAGDLYLYAGRNPYAKYPLIAGHEVCGEVVATGPRVTRVRKGERVVIEPVVGCGHCYSCRIGKHNCCMNFCLIGLHRPGGYAELTLVPEQNIHRVPESLDAITASLAEPLTIGIHACRRATVRPGELVLVLGAGPIGLAIIEVARELGARVVVADISQERLQYAATLGAETRLSDDTIPEWARSQTEGAGAPVVIEATGNPKAIEMGLDAVAPGGRYVIVGLVKKGMGITFPGLDFTRKEVSILGSRNSVDCFPEAIRLLSEGRIRYASAITRLDLWKDATDIFPKLNQNPFLLHKGVFIVS